MPLVAANDFEGLPKEPIARWLRLRDIVEKRLDYFYDLNNGGNEVPDLLEYIKVLGAAADELGVGPLVEVSPANVREEFDVFRASVAGLATRLSLRSDIGSVKHSVAIARPTRKRILGEIETLRILIKNSELSDRLKGGASSKIDQLQILIIADKTDIASVGVLLALIGGFAVGATSIAADLPTAIGNISAFVGADKLDEENEQALIEDLRSKLQIPDLRDAEDNTPDDQIPF